MRDTCMVAINEDKKKRLNLNSQCQFCCCSLNFVYKRKKNFFLINLQQQEGISKKGGGAITFDEIDSKNKLTSSEYILDTELRLFRF